MTSTTTTELRIGVLGGTFDPPHLGHLRLAQACIEQLLLDTVLFIPANKNPLKQRHESSPRDRLRMTQLLIDGHEKMAVSDIEITRAGHSFAVDTMEELQAVQPAQYWFIMGADAALEISNWKNPQRLAKLCRFAVALRGTTLKEEVILAAPDGLESNFDFIDFLDPNSSTRVRDNMARSGHSPLIPPAIESYAREHKLYE